MIKKVLHHFAVLLTWLADKLVGLIHDIPLMPGKEIAEDDSEAGPIGPLMPIPESDLERLRLPWNSEDFPNWPVAASLAKLSQIAYDVPANAERRFNELGFTSVYSIPCKPMQAFVVGTEDVAAVVFRGTDEKLDWLFNAAIKEFGAEFGSCHLGFFAAFSGMKSELCERLVTMKPKHLWITGHSLGGAMALVCACELALIEGTEISGIITFGQPRVVSATLAERIKSELAGKYAYVVNRKDAVPRVARPFAYCGRLVWFTDEGLKFSPSTYRMSAASTESSDQLVDFEDLEPLDEVPSEMLAESPTGRPPIAASSSRGGAWDAIRNAFWAAFREHFDHHACSCYVEECEVLCRQANTEL